MPDYYAQIDSDGRVIGLSSLAGALAADDLIPIDEELYNNRNLLCARYADGEFRSVQSRLQSDKALIAPGGAESLTVTLRVTDWKERLQDNFDGTVVVEVNGQRQPIEVAGGSANFTLSSDEQGTFLIRTVGLDRNAELKVVVANGF